MASSLLKSTTPFPEKIRYWAVETSSTETNNPASDEIDVQKRLNILLDNEPYRSDVGTCSLTPASEARQTFLLCSSTCRDLMDAHKNCTLTRELMRVQHHRFRMLALVHARDLGVIKKEAPGVIGELRSAVVASHVPYHYLTAALSMLACASDDQAAAEYVGEIKELFNVHQTGTAREKLYLARNLSRVGLAVVGDKLQATLLRDALVNFDAALPDVPKIFTEDPALMVFYARAALWVTLYEEPAAGTARLIAMRAVLKDAVEGLPNESLISLWACNFQILALFREAMLEGRQGRSGAEEKLGEEAVALFREHQKAAAKLDINMSDDEDEYVPGEYRVSLYSRLRKTEDLSK
jgi:hypothetical protein